MSFTGKATYAAGTDLPEIMEDVSDVIGIVSPFETPLLDYLGDAKRHSRRGDCGGLLAESAGARRRRASRGGERG